MPDPKLVVRDLTPPVLAVVCESGRHVIHPGETCDEVDELQAMFRSYLDHCLADAYAEADRLFMTGNGAGAPAGFLGPALREPTLAERAFAILEPHLGVVSLYRAGPPALRGPNWKARP